MPAKLSRKDEDTLGLALGGLPRAEFQDALAKVRSIPGRRWNPDDKVWEFPNEIETAIKITQMIGPDLSPEITEWLKDSTSKIAGELTTRLPEDADLSVPWADRLYAYQRAAVDFLAGHPHSILADDMGLGKTLEAITTIYEYIYRQGLVAGTPPEPGPNLIVCPNPMRRTWANEIINWANVNPDHVQILDGKTPATRKKQIESSAQWTIVNWEKLRIMPELADIDWLAVIADEAHRAKNRKAKQTQALWQLTAPIQLALTGTPIMNSPDELWSLMRWLYPLEYKSYWRFHNMYVDDYEVFYGNRKTRVVTGVKNADKLRFELADKLVRRTKEGVLDLPAKTRQHVPIDLHPAQEKLYREIENQLVVEIKQAVKADTADRSALEQFAETGDIRNLAMVIPNGAARVTRLRQVASSPALLGDGEEDKSAKYDAVEEIIADNRGKPFVVFCWFKGAADLIAERLRKKHKLRAQAMTGDTSTAQRDDLIERFQGGDLDVLVCTISTGGVGLTLTAADTAIFVERDWTPAINEQAEDRLHRIGQDNHVTILVLEATGTVDTVRVGPKNRLKEAIVGQVLGES